MTSGRCDLGRRYAAVPECPRDLLHASHYPLWKMYKNQIAIHQSILIHHSREVVWDFTQNYDLRTEWDRSVLQATVMQNSPNRMVKLKMKGNTTVTYLYKLDERPNRTTLAACDITSPFIKNLGGSWTYETHNGQTRWTQKGTIILKDTYLLRVLNPVFRFLFNYRTKIAMRKAKRLLEKKK